MEIVLTQTKPTNIHTMLMHLSELQESVVVLIDGQRLPQIPLGLLKVLDVEVAHALVVQYVLQCQGSI